MSPMRIILLLLAAAAAVVAAIMMKSVVNTPAPQVVTSIDTVIEEREVSEIQVLVARNSLTIGQLLTSSDFEWAPWPEANLVDGYFTEATHPDAMEELMGSVVKAPIYENEPILPQKLVVKGETGYMAALVKPGMRAMSVQISTESASGGFILPNDRVDVILTHEVEVNQGEFVNERPVTTTIIQNVRILAIDQIFRQDEETGTSSYIGQTATLELDPREVELLALADRMGRISLSLRPWSDAGEGRPVASRTDMLEVGGVGSGSKGVTVYRNGEARSATLGGS